MTQPKLRITLDIPVNRNDFDTEELQEIVDFVERETLAMAGCYPAESIPAEAMEIAGNDVTVVKWHITRPSKKGESDE